MKKLVALLLAVAMIVCCFAGCGTSSNGKVEDKPEVDSEVEDKPEGGEYKVAMITDYGDITDESFNQITYEACKAFCEANEVDFTYFKPAGDTTADRVAMVDKAVDEGYNVIVMPGYTFGGTIVEVSEVYSDVKFVALDVGAGDILDAGVPAAGETYDYTPENWNVTDYYYEDNVYCAIYQEELCGYMAGYAAVKMGYTDLGFLGGMAVASVLRYGYGFVQGVDAASAELGIQTNLKFAFGNQFYGDADIKAAMDTWYQSGTEVVFPCVGAIYVSPAEAAAAAGGKIIGVDTDQAAVIDGTYGEGLTITSAMKGLYNTTYNTLSEIILNDNWASYAGKIESLGLVSGDDVEANYVQIPYESTQWCDAFTQEDYMALVSAMYDGTITVSNDVTAMPETTNTNVEFLGNIK